MRREEAERKRFNQSVYFDDLAKIVDEKRKPQPVQYTPKPQKHNPITNPIEYHIDNPYILKKIQKKYDSNDQPVSENYRRWINTNSFILLVFNNK